MTNKDNNIAVAKIIDLLSENVDSLSDEELLQDAIADYGSAQNVSKVFQDVIESAKTSAGYERLKTAMEEYSRLSEQVGQVSKISTLSYEQKLVVIERVRERASEFSEQLTRAARGELGDEKDIDNFLEDLEILGFLDDHNLLSDL